MFESTGIVNEETLNKLGKHIMAPIGRRIIVGMTIFCIVFGFISLLVSNFLIFIFLLLAGFFVGEYFLIIYNNKKRCIRQIEETVGKREFNFKLSFDEDGILTNNLDTKASINLRYEIVKRFVEIEELYAIFTKSNQFVTISKSCLDNNQREEFKMFIKEKCKNIKFES